MYLLDTVVYHTKNIFVKEVLLDVKKLDFSQNLTSDRWNSHGGWGSKMFHCLINLLLQRIVLKYSM